MLTITIPQTEYFDEERGVFILVKEQTIRLEHSLVSISKWESRWHKPFLAKEPKTDEEAVDYIRCMNSTQNVDPLIFYAITPELNRRIKEYIEDSMTATTIKEIEGRKRGSRITTSELIYCWMIELQIPFECQKWHLNRLLMLIRVCNIESGPKKKMNPKQAAAERRALNASRKMKHGTRG